ncbi:NAD(P)H-quinone oxidoreductase subunit U, chloroplastic-like isoform X3 [Phragmites australis]|uniref:NAD(P)H-quinone oxidoreductase subunit U, chloroplastic-like isoform X3 n=1 Tax=Phragmites australis TaxID=29695 RepID=UPI002D78C039|nr:NAD(P)H-quinone oxidoreductase subunit U, chloroplastic-like isoform X3 [Phragmites australis]
MRALTSPGVPRPPRGRPTRSSPRTTCRRRCAASILAELQCYAARKNVNVDSWKRGKMSMQQLLIIALHWIKAITDADHYGRLGVTKLASTDEVKAAYEKKCEELNSEGPEEEELNKEHDLLKESFTILSTEEERRLYDWSLSRSGQPERYVWPFQVDPLELAPDPPKEPEDEFPTKLVGYFFLAWFILSVAFSVTLNR